MSKIGPHHFGLVEEADISQQIDIVGHKRYVRERLAKEKAMLCYKLMDRSEAGRMKWTYKIYLFHTLKYHMKHGEEHVIPGALIQAWRGSP
jgi:hypothetical protein